MSKQFTFTVTKTWTAEEVYGKNFYEEPKFKGFTFVGFQMPVDGNYCLDIDAYGNQGIRMVTFPIPEVPVFVYTKDVLPLCRRFRIAEGENPRIPKRGEIINIGPAFIKAEGFDRSTKRAIFEEIP